MKTNNKPVTPTQVVATQAVYIEAQSWRKQHLKGNTDSDRLRVLYYDGLLATVAQLATGNYEWDQMLPMAIAKDIEHFDYHGMFLDAFGYQIGAASGVLAGVSEEVRDSVWPLRFNSREK